MWYNYCLHFTDEKVKSTEGLSNLPKVTQPVKEGWNLNPAVRLQRELLPLACNKASQLESQSEGVGTRSGGEAVNKKGLEKGQ